MSAVSVREYGGAVGVPRILSYIFLLFSSLFFPHPVVKNRGFFLNNSNIYLTSIFNSDKYNSFAFIF